MTSFSNKNDNRHTNWILTDQNTNGAPNAAKLKETHCTLITQLTAIFLQLVLQTKNQISLFSVILWSFLPFTHEKSWKWKTLANFYIDVEIKLADSFLIDSFCLIFSFKLWLNEQKIHQSTLSGYFYTRSIQSQPKKTTHSHILGSFFVMETRPLFSRISDEKVLIEQIRARFLFVSTVSLSFTLPNWI